MYRSIYAKHIITALTCHGLTGEDRVLLLGDYDDFSNIDNSTIFAAMSVSNKNPYGGTYELAVDPSNSRQFIVRINGLNKSDCEALVTKAWTDSVGYASSEHKESGATGNCGEGSNNVVSITYGE